MAVYRSLRRDLQPRGAAARAPLGPLSYYIPPCGTESSSPQSRSRSPLTQEWEPPFPKECMTVHILSIPEWAYLPLIEGSTAPSPQRMSEWAAALGLPPPPNTHTHAEPSCCLSFWAGCQKGEEAPGAPGGWDQGKARRGGPYGGGAQSVLVRQEGLG